MTSKSVQFSLPFLDTTNLNSGQLGLYSDFGKPTPAPASDEGAAGGEGFENANPIAIPARDFRLAGDRALSQGWKARAADNLAAMRLAAAIEDERRNATPEEQEILAKFVAFGAGDLANNLFRRAGAAFPPGWETLGDDLERLVSREDLASLARATQYAHFTPEFVIRAMWRALRRMGFAGGCILEPGCGTGLFFALQPEALVGKCALSGVEMDATTARIASLLFPNALIRHEDFTKARLPDVYDLVLGNPPFSDRAVRADDPAGRLRLSLHDYFIARSVERLRPGGLAAFVTSRWTMDKSDPTARAHIASYGDFIVKHRFRPPSFPVAGELQYLRDGCPRQPRIRWDLQSRTTIPVFGKKFRAAAPLFKTALFSGSWAIDGASRPLTGRGVTMSAPYAVLIAAPSGITPSFA